MHLTTNTAHLWAGLIASALLWRMATSTPSIALKYCASVNTGASTAGNNSIFQSDGLCFGFCHDRHHSLAIVQGSTCWCSDTDPSQASQQGLANCSSSCPGFPDDWCGGNGLFVYMDTGLQGSPVFPPSSAPSQGPPATSSATRPVLTPITSISVNTSATSGGTTAAPSPTVQTVTESGTVRTVTVTPTETNAATDTNVAPGHSGGLGVGPTVGIAVAVVAIAAAAIAAIFFVWRRRKQREAQAATNSPSPRGSSAGMMSSSKAAESGSTPPYLGRTEGQWESDQSGRRRSMLMPIDPRIDPAHSGIYNRDGNVSHDSINTLRDDQDYSRRVHQPTKVLRATNPDPHTEE